MGSYSVVQCVKGLIGQPFYHLAADAGDAGAWGERLWWWLHPWLSNIALLPWLPGFTPQAFPTTISSLTLPWSISSQSIATLNWVCSTIPKLQLRASAPSRRPTSMPDICMAMARTVWLSFHLGCHRSAILLSALNVSPLTQTIDPVWRLDPCFSSLHPLRAGPVLLTLLFFPLVPLSYQVFHGYMYSFPLARSSCLLSAGFCMHFCVWRCILDVSMERDVLHTHLPPVILFSQIEQFFEVKSHFI